MVMVLGGGAFGSKLGHKVEGLMNGISDLTKEISESLIMLGHSK